MPGVAIRGTVGFVNLGGFSLAISRSVSSALVGNSEVIVGN
jgi:hypothetical protein